MATKGKKGDGGVGGIQKRKPAKKRSQKRKTTIDVTSSETVPLTAVESERARNPTSANVQDDTNDAPGPLDSLLDGVYSSPVRRMSQSMSINNILVPGTQNTEKSGRKTPADPRRIFKDGGFVPGNQDGLPSPSNMQSVGSTASQPVHRDSNRNKDRPRSSKERRTVNLSEDESDDDSLNHERNRKRHSKGQDSSYGSNEDVTNGDTLVPESSAVNVAQQPDLALPKQPVLPRALLASVKARRSLKTKPLDSDGVFTASPSTDTPSLLPAIGDEAEGAFARKANRFMAAPREAERIVPLFEEAHNNNAGPQVEPPMPIEAAAPEPQSTSKPAEEEVLVETPKKAKKRKSADVANAKAGKKAGLEHDSQLGENFQQEAPPATADLVTPESLDESQFETHTAKLSKAEKREKKRKKRKERAAKALEQASSQAMAQPDEMLADVDALGEEDVNMEAQNSFQLEEGTPSPQQNGGYAVHENAVQSDDHVQAEEAPRSPANKRKRSRKSKETVPESTVEVPATPPFDTIEHEDSEVQHDQLGGDDIDMLDADGEPDDLFEPAISESQPVEPGNQQSDTDNPEVHGSENHSPDSPISEAHKPETVQQTDDEAEVAPISPPKKRRMRPRDKAKQAATEEEPTEVDISPPKKSSKKRKRTSRAKDSEEPTEVDIANEDEDQEPAASPKKKQKAKKSRPSSTADRTTRKDHGRRTDADIELATTHELGSPLDLRAGGSFSKDEAELLRRHVKQYMHNNNLSVDELVDFIQWTKPYAKDSSEKEVVEDTVSALQRYACATLFWKDVYGVLPMRMSQGKNATTAVQRFIRRKWHKFKGHAGWTPEEEETLMQLYDLYPDQWKKISQIMEDRDPAACRDRWRNYLMCEGRNTNKWQDDEIDALIKAVMEVWQLLNEAREREGKRPLTQISSKDISWKAVSERMGKRSRLQCAQKFRSLSKSGKLPQSAAEHHAAVQAALSPGLNGKGGKKKKEKKEQEKKQYPTEDDMRWGDKLEMIVALTKCDFTSHYDIDWKQVAQEMEGVVRWKRSVLENAFKELCRLATETMDEEEADALDLDGIIEAITNYLTEKDQDQLDDRYVPPPMEEELAEQKRMEREAEKEERAAEKKRKSDAAGKKRGAGKRKRASGSAAQSSNKKSKSSEFITASDDDL